MSDIASVGEEKFYIKVKDVETGKHIFLYNTG